MCIQSKTKSIQNYCILVVVLAISFSISQTIAQEKFNIIQNGQFDNGDLNWWISSEGKSSAIMEAIANSKLSGAYCLKVDIEKGGDSLKDVRVFQAVPIQMGRYYNISFLAASNRKCKIAASITDERTSSATIWKSELLEINQTSKRFGPFVFRNQTADASRGFAVLFGGNDSTTIYLDSVVVEKSDDPLHDRDEEITQKSLKGVLEKLSNETTNEDLKLHYKSIIHFISDQYNLFTYDYSPLKNVLKAFTDTTVQSSPRKLSSYLSRKRPIIIAWTSPTDGRASFGLLVPSENYNPEATYPLYLSLHGLWSVAANPIEYLAYNLSPERIVKEPYEDGYLFLPWGRGNLWYEGISETDIWEGISIVEKYYKVNPLRKYITGHSMGGYGAWIIAQKTPKIWAGVGVHAGALWYGSNKYVSKAVAQQLKNVPVYFVCGTNDGLMSINQQAFSLLQSEGNQNISFATFTGGHEYLYDNVKNMYNWLKKFQKNNSTDIQQGNNQIPADFKLDNCYPNPFNPNTIINWQIPAACHVSLKVYDILGKEITSLINEYKSAGKYETEWDASNLTSGVYFCELIAGGKLKTGKMLLLK